MISQWAAVGALEAGQEYCRGRMAAMAAARQVVLSELDAGRKTVLTEKNLDWH